MKKKILIAYHFFAHYRAGILNELQNSQEYEFHFAGDTKDPNDSGIEAIDFNNFDNFKKIKSIYLYKSFMIQPDLLKLIIKERYDAIIFLGDAQYITTWIAAVLAKVLRAKVVFWTIGWMRPERGYKALYRNTFYKLADHLLLYGNYAKQIGIQNGFSISKMGVVYNSLDLKYQKQTRNNISPQNEHAKSRAGFTNLSPIVICISRLTKKRGLDQLIDAAHILKERGKVINLLFVGDGAEKDKLITQATEKGISFRFFGPCYDEKTIAELYAISAVTAAPGMVGLTAMQSLAYGVPIITHNSPDKQAPEWEAIEEGITGDFFKYGDAADLANCLDRWTNRMLPSSAIKDACYKSIEKFYNPEYQALVIHQTMKKLIQ